MNRNVAVAILLVSGAFAVGCTRAEQKPRPTVAFVTNGVADFWTIAESGAHLGGKDFDVNVEVRMPPNGPDDQRRMIEELLTIQVAGIAVSPINPLTQADILNEAILRTNVITQDSDAPNVKRLCYVGMDNYLAGRECGKLVKEAIPDGGEVILFVGRLGQLNADLRRQGVIDELMDRSLDPARRDEPSARVAGEKYIVVDTRTDNFNFSDAKAQPEDALSRYPNIKCMVGLFAYNPPYILEAVKGAGKQDSVKVVAFDESEGTLQAIEDGTCHGTIVQNPYKYGYESIRILAGLARGDKSVLPQDGVLYIPHRVVKKDNVREFWDDLKAKVAAGNAAQQSAASGSSTTSEAPAAQESPQATEEAADKSAGA